MNWPLLLVFLAGIYAGTIVGFAICAVLHESKRRERAQRAISEEGHDD